MYDAPFDAVTLGGWSLVAAVVVLLVARALRVEARARRGGPRAARSTAARVLDGGLDAVLALAVVALLAVLVVIVTGAP